MTASKPPNRTLTADLPASIDRHVTVEGWVHRRRRLSAVSFLLVRDRSGLAQVVITAADHAHAHLHEYPEETVVRVTGTATANPQAPGAVELIAPTVQVLAEAASPPVELWRPTLDVSLPVLLDHAPVTWRHPSRRAVWQMAADSVRGFRTALNAADFTEIHTPKLVASASESGSTVFAVDYFGRAAYLAQSPQFFKQAMVGVFERVYEIGPVFRAEPHDTARHLAEYVSMDAELGFIADHHDVIQILHHAIAGMVDAIAAGGAAARAGARLPQVPERFPVVHFRDALRIVGAAADEPDLAPEHERALGAWAQQRHGSEFLVVEGYPAKKRPFYTHPQPDNPRWTNSFDLLFRGLELVTGGQRLHRYADYLTALQHRGEPIDPYIGYLQVFHHGMPPHGGFAIGLERWLARLTGADNIRRTTLFPRDLHRLSP